MKNFDIIPIPRKPIEPKPFGIGDEFWLVNKKTKEETKCKVYGIDVYCLNGGQGKFYYSEDTKNEYGGYNTGYFTVNSKAWNRMSKAVIK